MSIDEMEKFIRLAAPGLWEKCYPRSYDNLGKFHSPRIPAVCLANAVIAAMQLGLENTGARNQFMAACCVDAHKVPTFFVTSAIVNACANTSLPMDMRWTDTPMPHPGMILIFERGSVKHPTCGEVAFVAVGRLQSASKLTHSHLPGFSRNVPLGAFISMYLVHESPQLYTYDLSLSENSSRVQDVDNANNWVERQGDELAAPMADEEAKFNQWLTVLAMKIVLVMNARPDQVSPGTCLRTVKAKRPGESRREFWSPNIVGQNYAVQRTEKLEPQGGHVRMHWRRGHFTRQPYGPGRTLRKTLWLEPMLVGDVG